MPRNLDLAALRAFSTIASSGGITRAAGLLNLTQSAVSMQLKRLEEALGQRLMERDGRGVRLTAQGEAALPMARRMIALNDELLERMRHEEPEGEIRLGVPHDIVPGVVPAVMRAFAAEYPGVRVTLISSVTLTLHEMFRRGACDVMLGTEDVAREGGEVLASLPLVWVGAEAPTAHLRRPVPLAFEETCLFRSAAQSALEAAGLSWEVAVSSDHSRSIDASVGADLALHVVVDGFSGSDMHPLPPGALPELGHVAITLYAAAGGRADPARDRLIALLRDAYGALRPSRRRPSLSIAAS